MPIPTKVYKIRSQVINGITYYYEDHPYWDKQLKQMRHKRIYGKYDSDGNFVPNNARNSAKSAEQLNEPHIGIENKSKRLFAGATYLLDQISLITGVYEDLQHCFPNDYLKILSLAYYLTINNDNPLYRFSKFHKTHQHPYGEDISSQRISELLVSISENSKLEFFRRQTKRRLENEYLAYDTTSISSYSELINQVKFGHNKDCIDLPQINLAMIFGEESMLPVYYRKLPGNINDAKTIKKVIIDTTFIDILKVKLVMDRGFYSLKNIQDLINSGINFIVGAKNKISYIKEHLQDAIESGEDIENYIKNTHIHCQTYIDYINLKREKNGKTIDKKIKIYIHIYCDKSEALFKKDAFMDALEDAVEAVKAEKATEKQKLLVAKYIILKQTMNESYKLIYNKELIKKETELFGYFVIVSNTTLSSREILYIYRKKDVVEKAFNNLKNRLGSRTTMVKSEEALEGKLFIQFISLILTSYIHQTMKTHNLYVSYTLEELLDELDIIEVYKYNNFKHYSEITGKQESIFKIFSIAMPNTML